MLKKEKKKKQNIAIIGLGLLGASLGMALKTAGYNRLGWTRRCEVREWAIEHDVIDETSKNVRDVLKKADITILCLPIPEIIRYVHDYAKCWRKDSIVTDIGSVKGIIVKCGESVLSPLGIHFIGSHPMAGTEKSGPESAFPELYDNAEVFVATTNNSNLEAVNKVIKFWESINTSVVKIDSDKHDILVAHTSHVAHLLALALTQTVLDCPADELKLRYTGCATGFRDSSRISSSSPTMWREIIENNHSAVLDTVKEVEKRLQHLRRIIESNNFDQLEKEFLLGKKLRDNWIKYKKQKNHCNW
jgi:prephenate dehydrogenase